MFVASSTGATFQGGRPQPVAGDPLSLSVPVRALPTGVYSVRWRVDSEVDGHATRGTFAFGVRVPAPAGGTSVTIARTTPISSPEELVARWVLLLGLVALLGAAAAELARFGDGGRGDELLALGGWAAALVGLLALADAQRRNADSSLAALLSSPVGHALILRAVAIVVAGVGLLVARSARRLGFAIAAAATLAAIVAHVDNGHAAAGSWSSAVTVIAQSAHVAAVGVWLGGLAALAIGVGSMAAPRRELALRRFALVAAAGLGVVAVTGVLRALSELHSVDQLWSTGYGRAVLAKAALIVMIAAAALRSRAAASAGQVSLLRRRSAIELSLAAVAIGAAALLGTLAPPVAGQSGVAGLSASGSDSGHTVRVSLSADSNQPGPNRFVARVSGYSSGESLRDATVVLLFAPLDDPGTASSSLALARAADGSYAASGPNLRFDGRWAVRVLVRRNGSGVEVPLELDPIGAPQSISIERIPGQPPKYTKLDGNLGFVRISPHPERAGPSELYVTCYDAAIGQEIPIREVVVTLARGDGPVAQQPIRRVGIGSFIASVNLAHGRNEIAVIAHTAVRTRLRSVFDLNLP